MSADDRLSRRHFLKASGLMGAGALLPIGRSRAGVVLKGLIPDDDIIPGVSYWFPSTCAECHAGCGVNVRVREGNAVKIEGNEGHPVNRGGLCARGQAALQALYSPARIRSPLARDDAGNLAPVRWEDIGKTLTARLHEISGNEKKRIVVVTRQVTGGMRAMLEERVGDDPRASFIVSEPLDYAAIASANKLCFGIEAVPTYDLSKARTIVSFGADLFETWLSPVSAARGFAESRKLNGDGMSRLIQFESHMSLTGANADERYACRPGDETRIAMAVASRMLTDGALPPKQLEAWRKALAPFSAENIASATVSPQLISRIADLLRSNIPSLAVAGGPNSRSSQAAGLQGAVNLINTISQSYGNTISFDRIENAPIGSYMQLLSLVGEMEAGRIGAVIVHDTNLEFAFPRFERLEAALKRVPLKVKLASVNDSEADWYDFILPGRHWLERWDLVEPRSGLHSVQQPIIAPWLDSRHPGQALADILSAWSGKTDEPVFDYEQFLRDRWDSIRRQTSTSENFSSFWRGVLADGGHWADPVSRKVELDPKAAELLGEIAPPDAPAERITLLPITTVRHGDGRQTGSPWLNELPDPITSIVWESPMLISPETAVKWKCQSGDVVELESGGRSIKAPVQIQPGTSDSVVAIALGAPSASHLAYHYPEAAHPLHMLVGAVDETSGALSWTDTPIKFKGVVGRERLARVQAHDRQDGRGIAQTIAIGDIGKKSAGGHAGPDPHKYDLYPIHEHPIHDWGMVIDLSACVGCGACVVACQSENNVAVVGKDQCLMGRELSWLRIERFYDNGRAVFLPMLCQQCEHAPCETVCPVYASVHSSEGLNVQVYNRCVGTRYCANNCPYKVRRFNWYTYKVEEPLDRQLNPDISIRTRGIMEKCTFCVQRIREHKEIAKDEERPLRDGEIVPACAQSCPTRAITFGDLNDKESRVTKLFGDPRGYAIFSRLNTQPSVVYLKRVHHGDLKPVNES